MSEKKYYWIKLKQSLMTSDKVDYLMSQKDGANYVVLYQCLCLLTTNTNGVLGKEIGEIIIPYDVDKIQRDTKWFTKDTILVALELYKKLGLIYQLDNGLYQIKDFNELVGSETSGAKRIREYRERKALQCNKNVTPDVTQEIEYRDRDKSIDKDLDLDLLNNNNETEDDPPAQVRFSEINKFIGINNLVHLKPLHEYNKINVEGIEDWQNYLLKENERLIKEQQRC